MPSIRSRYRMRKARPPLAEQERERQLVLQASRAEAQGRQYPFFNEMTHFPFVPLAISVIHYDVLKSALGMIHFYGFNGVS